LGVAFWYGFIPFTITETWQFIEVELLLPADVPELQELFRQGPVDTY
jgi:hypothetical protein